MEKQSLTRGCLSIWMKGEMVRKSDSGSWLKAMWDFLIRKPANPGNFDQKNYYKQQDLQAVLWKGKVLEKQVKKTSFREKLWQFRGTGPQMRSAGDEGKASRGYFVCGSSGRFFLYRRESERYFTGWQGSGICLPYPVCIFLFWATDFTGGLGKPDFLFYRPV